MLEVVDAKDPVLNSVATVDPFSTDIVWKDRETEMFELMDRRFGIGLAAPQIGDPYRMFVMKHSVHGPIGIYNPEIVETTGSVSMEEGCLTFPLLYMIMTRPEIVKVRYTKTDGVTVVEETLSGIDARCFLHEYDHLQGVLFVNLVSDFKLKMAINKRDKRFTKLQRALANKMA
jgi:peptide deformylase